MAPPFWVVVVGCWELFVRKIYIERRNQRGWHIDGDFFFFFNQCDPGDTAYNNLHIDKFRCRSGFFFGPTQNLRGLSAAAEYPIPLTFFFPFSFISTPSRVATPSWPSHKLSLSSLCPWKANTRIFESEKKKKKNKTIIPPETSRWLCQSRRPTSGPLPASPSWGARVCVTSRCVSLFSCKAKDFSWPEIDPETL